jgi:hypothetical protein
MTRIARTCALLLLTCAQAGLAAGQTVPTSFTDLKFVVRPGDRVMVVDRSGIETAGRISELDASMLTLSTNAGQIRFREDDVVLIRQRKQDSVWNGIAIGAAIGGGLGLLSELSCGGYEGSCGPRGAITLGSAVWGVGVGVLADVLQKTPRDIYRHGPVHDARSVSVTPLVGPHTAGTQIALRW